MEHIPSLKPGWMAMLSCLQLERLMGSLSQKFVSQTPCSQNLCQILNHFACTPLSSAPRSCRPGGGAFVCPSFMPSEVQEGTEICVANTLQSEALSDTQSLCSHTPFVCPLFMPSGEGGGTLSSAHLSCRRGQGGNLSGCLPSAGLAFSQTCLQFTSSGT